MSAKDILMKYAADLHKKLPMNDPYFLSTLEQYIPFPGNTKEMIESKATNAEKAEYFIQYVVKTSPDLHLPKLFQAIKQYCKNSTNIALQKLVDNMKAEIDGMLTIRTVTFITINNNIISLWIDHQLASVGYSYTVTIY